LIAAFQQSSAASELTAVACGGVMPNWPEHTAVIGRNEVPRIAA
jgi:hypothetical protein